MKHPKTEQQMYYIILRSQNNLTIEDVAKLSGTSTKTVWRFERGKFKRISGEIKKIMNFYYELHKSIIEKSGKTDEKEGN